jgi:enoyl-CoA hydratase
VPRAVAVELLLTGEPMDAERAAAVGLVNRVVDEGTALDAAVALAGVIAANGPLAVAATKEIVQSAPVWGPEEMWARQDQVIAPVFASEDAREGSVAFAERRPPVWRGR